MFKILVAIFFGVFLWSGLHAAQQNNLTKNQIMITDNGFIINLEGYLFPADTISYIGNGIYSASVAYYGSCGRCGWALDRNGKCPNQSCNQYGPREK
jgi:hypothetical protein